MGKFRLKHEMLMEHFFEGISLLRGMRQIKLEEVTNTNLLLRVKL